MTADSLPGPLLSKSSHGRMWLTIDIIHHLQQTAVCVARFREHKAMLTPFI